MYKAFDPKLDREVALKVIRADKMENPDARQRFIREAKAAAQLKHESIVRIHDLVEIEEDRSDVIVMEYVEGERLSDSLDRGSLGLPAAMRLLREIAEGLAAAHKKGIVHRDLKTENVMITSDGHAKILDFGLAKNISSSELSLTAQGHIVGTLYCMSPEQADNREVDHRSDLFSLGALAYQMMTGTAPFLGRNATTTLVNVVSTRQQPASSVNPYIPGELSHLIDQLLEKNPDDRPQTAEEVASRLKRFARIPGLSTSEAVPLPRKQMPSSTIDMHSTPKKPERWSLRAVLIFLVPLLLLVSLAAVMFSLRPNSPTVAILGFENLSEEGGSSWHSGALSEILTAELTAGQQIRLVSEERIAEVKNDFAPDGLNLGEPEGLNPDTLKRLKSHLTADYVLLGSYQVDSEAGEPQLRVHLRLQDADDGDVPWQETFDSPDGNLFALAAEAGDALRVRLDADALSPEQRSQVRALFPAGTEALRLYFQGRDLLRGLEVPEARNLLKQAVELEPEHPRPHTAMAAALLEAGYPGEAAEAAQTASELAANWPPRERLEIEARSHEIARSWSEAAKTYEELYRDFPDISYGLRLAEAWIEAGETEAAVETLDALRQLPLSERSRARHALAESRANFDLPNYEKAKDFAERAAATAERIGAPFLAARARFALGKSLNKLQQYATALEVLRQVRVDYEKADYPLGVKDAFHLIALIHVKLDELEEARKDLERFLAYFDNDPEAFSGVINLCSVLINLGRVSAARSLLETALDRLDDSLGSFERGDASLTFGIISQTLGDLEEAERFYEDAIHLYEELDDNWSVAMASTNLGELYFLEGRLDKALELHQKALDIDRELDKEAAAYDQFRLGKVRAAQGNVIAAGDHYETALDLSGAASRGSNVAKVRLAQAELELFGSKNVGVAANLAGEAEKTFWNAEMIDEAILAQTFRIEALFRQDQVTDARKQTQIVLGHAERSESWLVGFATALLDARVRAASRQDDDVEAALTALDDLVAEAARRGFAGHAFEARLAQGEIEKDSGRLEAAKARLDPLIEEAGQQGYGLVVQRAEALLGRR
ncbi:MAG: protein kinase [bacterium]|nr:protein kinase [bacterium]